MDQVNPSYVSSQKMRVNLVDITKDKKYRHAVHRTKATDPKAQ